MPKLLVIRNDKIGDFMLAWPSFALLKKQYPDTTITALVPEYTAPLAKQCEWIDEILIDKKEKTFFKDIKSLVNKVRPYHFDASISLFSETRTSLALFLAGVNTRIGPATKIAQVFLNRRLRQKRSRSLKPEYDYNLDLVRYYIHLNDDEYPDLPLPPYMEFDIEEICNLKRKYQKRYKILPTESIIIVHPGTGGSAINLSVKQYAELVHNISEQIDSFFIITSGPDELEAAEKLSTLLIDTHHCIHYSTGSIIEFSKFIALSDLFISGSTGPLHIAGALNLPTAAFYPSHRSATSLRWQTLNEQSRRITFTAPQNNMAAIDLRKASADVTKLLQTTSQQSQIIQQKNIHKKNNNTPVNF